MAQMDHKTDGMQCSLLVAKLYIINNKMTENTDDTNQ